MFSLAQIQQAHRQVQSGSDFPSYIQALISLGVSYYETQVTDGHTQYFGKNEYVVTSPAKYSVLQIAADCDATQFKRQLMAHQQGETDYLTFCADCARSGIEKWVVRTEEMTCTYYDKAGRDMLIEAIPAPPIS